MSANVQKRRWHRWLVHVGNTSPPSACADICTVAAAWLAEGSLVVAVRADKFPAGFGEAGDHGAVEVELADVIVEDVQAGDLLRSELIGHRISAFLSTPRAVAAEMRVSRRTRKTVCDLDVVEAGTGDAARGRVFRDLLFGENWTGRSAATWLGVDYAYVNRRLLVEVDLSFSDAQAFAPLVRKSGVELFAYLANVDSAVGSGGLEPPTTSV